MAGLAGNGTIGTGGKGNAIRNPLLTIPPIQISGVRQNGRVCRIINFNGDRLIKLGYDSAILLRDEQKKAVNAY